MSKTITVDGYEAIEIEPNTQIKVKIDGDVYFVYLPTDGGIEISGFSRPLAVHPSSTNNVKIKRTGD